MAVYKLKGKGHIMKIVTIKAPRFLRPILKKIFRMDK